VDVRGSAPGTRETDAIRPTTLVEKAHAVLLTGGSAFGLDAAAGVMQFLEEGGYGYTFGPAKIPVVPAAVIFDLTIGSALVRPNKRSGYLACLNASMYSDVYVYGKNSCAGFPEQEQEPQ
ncbi:P1 family peptidase, partial [Candidatus Poribacteria bacterium]